MRAAGTGRCVKTKLWQHYSNRKSDSPYWMDNANGALPVPDSDPAGRTDERRTTFADVYRNMPDNRTLLHGCTNAHRVFSTLGPNLKNKVEEYYSFWYNLDV